jgi:hypothetical protein
MGGMRNKFLAFWAVVALSMINAPVLLGQQQDQNQQQSQQQSGQATTPIPAYHSPLAGLADQSDDQSTSQQLSPDTRALAGVQDLSLGMPGTEHSSWQPNVFSTITVDSNPLSGNQSGWGTWSSFGGTLDLHRLSGNSDLTLTYMGGGTISNNGNAENGVVQGLDFVDKFSFRRSTLSIFDQLSYLPEAAFGFGGIGAQALPGAGSLGLSSNLTSTQSILSTRGQNLLNSSLAELDIAVTPRGSLTFSGGYSLLRDFNSDVADYGHATFLGGYNYQITPKDSLAVSYVFSAFRYPNYSQSINSNQFFASYGRRVTGKLSFRIAAGPEVSFFNNPISGTTGTTTSPTTNSGAQLYLTVNSSIRYELGRTNLSASYTRGVTGGSGVLAGAVTNIVSGGVSRQVLRTLNGNVNFGYARNTGLSVAGSNTVNQTYSYWFAGANVSHPWGPRLSVNLSYQLQYQDANSAFCIGVTCETSFVRHLISFGINWHGRPMPF